jgi:uroporphyrin-III C-methyltransferase/precorrin-2 dehydrogenase/sirohydrochlorin ferrochelatase
VSGDPAEWPPEPWALIFVALSDARTDRAARDLAAAKGIPVNVSDQPGASTFIMPAVVDRSPVLVAVSTGGHAPALSCLMRERLEALIEPGLGRLAGWAADLRERMKKQVKDFEHRRLFWNR